MFCSPSPISRPGWSYWVVIPKPYWAMNCSSDRPGADLSDSMPSLTRAKSTGTYSNPAAVMQSPMSPSTFSTLLASWSIDRPNSSEPKRAFPPDAADPEPEPPPQAARPIPAARPSASAPESFLMHRIIRDRPEHHLIAGGLFSPKSGWRPTMRKHEPSESRHHLRRGCHHVRDRRLGRRHAHPVPRRDRRADRGPQRLADPGPGRGAHRRHHRRHPRPRPLCHPQALSTSPSALKPSPGIVTNVPAPGTGIAEGGVVMTATGRPVFLLAGDRLGGRALGPGREGEDVP